jgi:Thioredoxin-like
MVRLLLGLWFFASVSWLTAGLAPLTIKEVSLMLRSGYSSEAVLQELSKRKFADTLDPTSEEQLVKAGASQSLINTLESGVYQLSAAETAAFKQKQQSDSRAAEISSTSSLSDNRVSSSAPANMQRQLQQGGSMYDHLKDDLVYWHEGSLVPFDDETLQKKKFYLLFFSAIWSKEGRQFTSRLVDYYNRVAPQHPEFEIVFFSADRSQFAMENYVSQTSMPWPVVAYDKLQGKAGALASAFTHQIPRLILAEASGRVLSDSGETRPEFDKVMIDLDKILAGN